MQQQIQENENANANAAPLQTSITFNRLKYLQSLIKEEAASRELCIFDII